MKYFNLRTYCFFLVIAIAFFSCRNLSSENKNLATNIVEQNKRPNIIFIMDDQHRWDALGKVNAIVKTPTLDGLAEKGVFFNQAVCQAPMCVPSRNAIMFGLYPNETGVYSNGDGLKDEDMPAKTMAQYFKDAGYETAGFGKTHWGKYTTSTRGFETRYAAEIYEEGAHTMKELNPDAKARYDAEISEMGAGEENNIGYLGFTSKLPESDHRDGWITNQAIKYIKNRKDERPLFFYLSYMKPHAGHNVPKGYEEKYDLSKIKYAQQPDWLKDYSPHAEGINRRDLYVNFWKNATDEEWRLMTMRYYANITWIDDMMGRTLEALKQKGVLENAIIIYTSDHGEMLGERYYRFNKYNLYDSSVRVPMIMSGSALPKKFKRGSVVDAPVENVDILPTLLDIANIKKERNLPGESLVSTTARKASFSALHEREGEAAFMWRTKDYKLILVLKRKVQSKNYTKEDIITGEFYNLKDDPKEWKDLYGNKKSIPVQKVYAEQLLNHLNKI